MPLRSGAVTRRAPEGFSRRKVVSSEPSFCRFPRCMRLIATSRAQDGSELGRDVMVGRPDGLPLLRSGVRMTARYRELLVKAGVSAIYVEDDDSSGIIVEPIVD